MLTKWSAGTEQTAQHESLRAYLARILPSNFHAYGLELDPPPTAGNANHKAGDFLALPVLHWRSQGLG